MPSGPAEKAQSQRPIPSVAIIPLAILLFGIDREASLVIVVFATFWQIFIQVLYGVADVDPVARDTLRSFGIPASSRFVHLVLPTALPYIMTGLRQASGRAIVGGRPSMAPFSTETAL